MNRFVIILLLLAVAGCNLENAKEPVHLLGEAQGTYYSVIYYDEARRDFQPQVDSLLKAFDRSLSLWDANSILSRINNNDTTAVLDKSFEDNFNLSMQVAEKTGGAFDVTVGPLVRAWGFGFDDRRHVDDSIIDSLMQITGYHKIHLVDHKIRKDDPRVSLDFNAIAQGYSVDLVGNFLESHGIDNYLVDIGGEVKAKGQKPDGSLWKVGIEKPAKHQDDPRNLKAVVALKNKSVATSGSYRKFYVMDGIRYSHTIDPKTGRPVQHSLLSVSVLADSTAVADAYATAFMVMGFQKSKQFVEQDPALEAYFIYARTDSTNQIYITKGFKDIITQEFK